MKSIVKQKQPTLQSIIDAAQTGGGGSVDAYTKAEADAKFQAKSDMTDYVKETSGYIVVNGIRIYVSSTAPTGDIPEGSVGLGW